MPFSRWLQSARQRAGPTPTSRSSCRSTTSRTTSRLSIDRSVASLDELLTSYELVVVDDGSTDESFARLARLSADDRSPEARSSFAGTTGRQPPSRLGSTTPEAGVIVPIDGDLQNDPGDIHLLLAKIDEGYDVVSGWRRERQDGLIRRTPSRIANWLIGRVTGVRLHDYRVHLEGVPRRGHVAKRVSTGRCTAFYPRLRIRRARASRRSRCGTIHVRRERASTASG